MLGSVVNEVDMSAAFVIYGMGLAAAAFVTYRYSRELLEYELYILEITIRRRERFAKRRREQLARRNALLRTQREFLERKQRYMKSMPQETESEDVAETPPRDRPSGTGSTNVQTGAQEPMGAAPTASVAGKPETPVATSP